MGNITTLSRKGKLNHTFQGWDTSPHFAVMGHITSLCRDDAHHCVLQEWDTTPHFPWIGYITQLSIDGTYHPSIQGWDILPNFQGWYISPQFPGIGHRDPLLSMNRTDFPSFSKIRYITYLCRDEIHHRIFQEWYTTFLFPGIGYTVINIVANPIFINLNTSRYITVYIVI